MDNPIFKKMSSQMDYEDINNQIYRMNDIGNSMNLMMMNSFPPKNVMFILNKIYSNGLKPYDEFDLNNLIMLINDFCKDENICGKICTKSFEDKKICYEMICLVDSFNDLITKDRGCISLESTQKIILFIRAFSKLKFYPNNFVFSWKDLSKYFNYPKSLLHIMQIMNYELTREAIHNHIDNICAKDILILSKINTYEYLEMSVKNAMNDYKIIDSKFIEKKNKIEEVLNKMKSSFFLNEKKNN